MCLHLAFGKLHGVRAHALAELPAMKLLKILRFLMYHVTLIISKCLKKFGRLKILHNTGFPIPKNNA